MSLRHKILFISSWFPNKIRLQDGNFVQRHAEAVNLYHDVEVLHAVPNVKQQDKYELEDSIFNNIRTVVVYYRDSGNPVLNNIRKFKAYLKGYTLLNKPDLVHGNVLHTNLLFALWLKKKHRIPYIVTEHFTDYRPINLNKLTFQQKRIANILGNEAVAITPVTSDLERGLKLLGIKSKMKVIPNVVDMQTFSPGTKEAKIFTFLHVSNLEPRKNPLVILEAAKDLLEDGLDFKLEIGGNASAENEDLVKKYIAHTGFDNKINFFGLLSSKEVAQKMKNANCFLLFSEDENQPCVIAESFASGLPVISSDVGGIAEFFPDHFGFLIKERTVAALKVAMEKIIAQQESFNTQEIADYAKRTFSKEIIAKQFSEIYEEILNEKLF